jgi:hypothetical protein
MSDDVLGYDDIRRWSNVDEVVEELRRVRTILTARGVPESGAEVETAVYDDVVDEEEEEDLEYGVVDSVAELSVAE